MSKLDIGDPQALDQFAAAVAKFTGQVESSIHQAQSSAGKSQEWISSKRASWQHKVERARQQELSARAAYERCMSSSSSDNRSAPSCGGLEHEWLQARAYRERCEAKLQQVRTWETRVAQGVAEFQKYAGRASQVLGNEGSKAQQNLKDLSRRYAAVHEGGAGAAAGLGAAISSAVGGSGSQAGSIPGTTLPEEFDYAEFQGRNVHMRKDIDWDRVDPNTGLTNKERIERGYSPYGPDGKKIQLHHSIQEEPGPITEITQTLHQKYKKTLHGLVGNGESFRNNPALESQYNKFRREYWKWRATNL